MGPNGVIFQKRLGTFSKVSFVYRTVKKCQKKYVPSKSGKNKCPVPYAAGFASLFIVFDAMLLDISKVQWNSAPNTVI